MRFRRFPLYQYLDLRRLSPCLRFSTSIRRRLICCGLFSVSVAYLPVIVSLYALRRRSILEPAIVAAFLKGGLNPSRHSVHSSLTKLLFKHFISLSLASLLVVPVDDLDAQGMKMRNTKRHSAYAIYLGTDAHSHQ